jgi:rhamnosyltransferase
MERAPVAAVVITYHPPAAILQNIAALAAQVDLVVIVDNTPGSDAVAVLNELEHSPRCTVFRNGKNLGIASALNIGIRHAVSLGFTWILTMDQDSRVSNGYVEAMLSGYEGAASHSRVGMLCPRYLDSRLNVEIPKLRAANGEISGCMTSGSMIEALTFELLGPFEEPLFIDYVDYEYCVRMRLLGFKIIECPQAVLLHSLGRITVHRILGRELPVTNHNPKRRYYINRNRLVLVRRYFRKDRDWALTELKAMVMDSMMILWVEDHKFAKAGYMLRALYDGMLNRLGQRVPL